MNDLTSTTKTKSPSSLVLNLNAPEKLEKFERLEKLESFEKIPKGKNFGDLESLGIHLGDLVWFSPCL